MSPSSVTCVNGKLEVPNNPIIPVIIGDGIGLDVTPVATKVLDAAVSKAYSGKKSISWMKVLAGEAAFEETGEWLPDSTLDSIRNHLIALKGPLTTPVGGGIRSLNVALRQKLDLYACVRPVRWFSGVPSPVKEPNLVDMIIFRENTEGLYAGVEFYPLPEPVYDVLNLHHKKMSRFDTHELDDVALSTRIMTRSGCRSIVRQAFEYSRNNNRKSVTLVDKPNILRETGGLMRTEAIAISKEYPEIEFQEVNMDAMCMWLVKNPKQYDVLVAENMFGDILSDLAAQLVGGLGFAGSANIGDEYAVFEPSHGSAPKYAGKNKVNPIATFLSLKMMLDWLEEKEKGQRLESAIANVIAEQKFGTYDMGMDHSSIELTEAICNFIENFSVEKIS